MKTIVLFIFIFLISLHFSVAQKSADSKFIELNRKKTEVSVDEKGQLWISVTFATCPNASPLRI